MTRKLSLIALALLLPLASAACGGRSAKPAPSSRGMSPQTSDAAGPESEAAPDAMDADSGTADEMELAPSNQEKIRRLWNQIRAMRLEEGLSAEPLVSATTRVHAMSVQEIRESSEHEQPKTRVCISTCKIEASICKNADSICKLASELGNNDWAYEKCDSGKASCDEATKKCADCVAGESP